MKQVAFRPLFVFIVIAIVFVFTLFFFAGGEDKTTEDGAAIAPAPTTASVDRQTPRYELTRITEPETSSSPAQKPVTSADEQIDAAKRRSEQAAARKRRIKSISEDIFRKLRKDEVATTDTIYLKSGRELNCTVIEDLGAQLRVRYKGVTTIIEKSDIDQMKHLSQQAVDMKMRRMSLEQAIRIVDTGLVPYGGDWITPEERDIEKQKARGELEKAKRESQRQAQAEPTRSTGVVRTVSKPPTIGGISQYSSVTVIEGYGFGDVVVGHPRCTRQFLISKFGKPDSVDKTHLNYYWKHGFRLRLGSESDKLIEIRFNRRFSGKLRSGISMSSSLADVFEAYGQPIEEIETDDLGQIFSNYANRTLYRKDLDARIWYRDLGLVFYIQEDIVKRITIIRI